MRYSGTSGPETGSVQDADAYTFGLSSQFGINQRERTDTYEEDFPSDRTTCRNGAIQFYKVL
jgi:hypothetical protein